MSGIAAEALGYAASALIAVSLMMTSVLRLRVVNLIGSVAFLVYGVLIGAVPVVVANVVIVVVNLVFLRRLLFVSEAFGVLRLAPTYLRVFPGTLLTQREGELLTWRA